MKQIKFILYLFLIFSCSCESTNTKVEKWEISYNKENNSVDVKKDSRIVFDGLTSSYKLDGKEISTKDYENAKTSKGKINDGFGKGTRIDITYTGNQLPKLVQSFYIYPEKEYILIDFTIETTSGELSSNYMAPVKIDQMTPVLNRNENNRALFVPFDNDCWVRYQSHPLTFDKLTSYEVTAVFNNTERTGIIMGSVEHDNWKTAIHMSGCKANNIGSLVCYGGVADSLTRDSKPHGAITGEKIKSPKIFVGFFDDWRTGLEEYGDANAIVNPPSAWGKSLPFGWNSWGVLQFGLTYPKALEVSDFFKNNLQNQGFVNEDKTVIIGLDSGWNSFTEDQLKEFVRKCKENGQVAGIYWTPFTDWGKNPEREVDDAKEYQYKDIYIYANGKPQDLDGAYAIDPTHPAIETRMRKTSDLFRRCGFEYVKMDFMTHGAMEGDKWYKPEIQTGIQAYNYGMGLLNKYFGDMYLNLSISPIFPSQYAQSRRIACDAWNKIKDTEYTMNAVSYGWWIDRVYQYNDADHIVLQQATEGENRARVTSAVITGLYIAGDDFSEGGSEEGKERAKKYLTNSDINAIATGDSFRPVEGHGEKSENQFVRTDETGMYYVVFNYDENEKEVMIPFERIGLDQSKSYQMKELWSGSAVDLKSHISLPGKDVKVFRISVQ